MNFSAIETAEVALKDLGTICEARGLSAANILEPVAEFTPAFTGATVTLPPMSLVRLITEG